MKSRWRINYYSDNWLRWPWLTRYVSSNFKYVSFCLGPVCVWRLRTGPEARALALKAKQKGK